MEKEEAEKIAISQYDVFTDSFIELDYKEEKERTIKDRWNEWVDLMDL